VTFIVTLAAAKSVTLAARAAGMSRKSAYALQSRDPAFAAAWAQVVGAPPKGRARAKADKADTPPPHPLARVTQGDSTAASISSTSRSPAALRLASQARDRFFARLAADLLRRQASGAHLSSPRQALSPASRGDA